MKYKKYIIILIISVVIFLSLMFIYNNFIIKTEYLECFVIKSDSAMGQVIDQSNIEKCKIDKKIDGIEYITDINLYSDYVFKHDVKSGTILKDIDLIKADKYEVDKSYEYISIKVTNAEDSVSYQVGKNKIVNLYYTAKTSQIEDIMQLFSYKEGEIKDYVILGTQEPFTTVKLLENIEIVDLFNKNGISVENKELLGTDTLIDTVMIKVKSDMAIRINNLKNYGSFSFSVVR